MTKLKRAVQVVLDGVGVGANPDVHAYGDDGASSLERCAQAIGGLALPHLGAIGLGNITPILGTPPAASPLGAYGQIAEAAIIKELGEEHVRIGRPILYTSADSVFQIAAHQDVIPLEELYYICEIARGMLTGDHAVGRVIDRPFIGTPGNFKRTEHRRDFSLPPLGTTLLDLLKASGKHEIGLL